MTYSPNSWTTTSEVLVKSATTTGVAVNVVGSTLATAANQTNGTQRTMIVNGSNTPVSVQTIGTVISSGQEALVTSTNIHGLSSAGGGTYVDVKVNPAGKLLVTADLEQGGAAVSASNPVYVQFTSASVSISNQVNITATSLPLPTGAATSAKQDTLISSLSNVESKITGLTIIAGRLQVELPSGGGGLTDTELRASPVVVSVTNTTFNIGNTVSVTGALTDTQLRASAVPVALTSSSVNILGGAVAISGTVSVVQSGTWNVNISATTLPLMTGLTVSAGRLQVETQFSGLTNTELRASPVPMVLTSSSVNITGGLVGISGTVAVTQSGTWNVNVSGTVAVTGALTNTEIRATPLPVSLTGTAIVSVSNTVTIGPIPAGTNNIGDVDILSAPTLSVNPIVATGATTTSLGATVAAQTVAAINANRLGLFIFNEVESGFMYLRYGPNASAASYSVRIAAGGFWEMPQPIYTGLLSAAFSVSTTTSAKITEVVK